MAAEIVGTFSPVERRRSIVNRAQENPIHPEDWTFKDSVAAIFQHEIDTIDSVVSFHNEGVFRIVLTDPKNLNFGMGDEEELVTAYFTLCHLKARLEILNAALPLVDDEATRGAAAEEINFWNRLVTLLLERVQRKIVEAGPEKIPAATEFELQQQIQRLCTLRFTGELQGSWFDGSGN
ncbi:hypothetical protein [Syntrophothermus lipocalidus]|uniref:Uncharacterized protein n=1 Tax=Syntrophothermus lipocalidus (strain DSM 12680 / TGB-C1) TaxID=643648 RepID=D7CPQ8_SYNLT|nr:hypothetical protein [Syntrophothermus lipocalidus]ADI02686.1 hypothetical protein Slip_1934 [Syntrophothermus lipocalidus DSM 12680]